MKEDEEYNKLMVYYNILCMLLLLLLLLSLPYDYVLVLFLAIHLSMEWL